MKRRKEQRIRRELNKLMLAQDTQQAYVLSFHQAQNILEF